MIELRSVAKVHPSAGGEVPALHDVDLTVERGDFVAVVGGPGSGKSTLLSLIGCLDVPTSGQVLFLGADTSTLNDDQLSQLRSRFVGLVFQASNLVDTLTVRGNVELPLLYAGVTSDRASRSNAALEELGLLERADEPAAALSLADQQRAAVARAIVNEAALIIADDPAAGLDPGSGAQLLETLRALHEKGRSLVLATESETIAAGADRVVRLAGGTISAAAKPERPPVRLARSGRRAELGR